MFFGLPSLSTIFFVHQEDVNVLTQIKIWKETSQLFLTLKSLKSSSRLSFSGTDSRWSKATRVLWERKQKETKQHKNFMKTLRTQLLKTSCTTGISSSSCKLRDSNKNRYNSISKVNLSFQIRRMISFYKVYGMHFARLIQIWKFFLDNYLQLICYETFNRAFPININL